MKQWIINESHKDEYEGITVWEGGTIVAHVVPDQHGNELINAKMIAATPEVTDALKGMLKFFVDYENDYSEEDGIPCFNAAREALAKMM